MNITHILKELSSHFITLTEHGFLYGPQGRLLQRNLEEQWFSHCVTMSRYNIFLSDEIINALKFVTNSAMGNIPFGLATIRNVKNNWNQTIIPELCTINSHRTAERTIYDEKTESKDLYHKIQKERKIWWRKLAQHPSRFKLTEAKNVKSFDLVNIEAQFHFGNIVVEKIIYHTDVRKIFSQIDNKNDFTDIQMVEHIVSLDWGCLALLCDMYDIDQSTKMRIHSKLAPHKVAFHIKNFNNKEDTQNDDLNRFVLYLNNMLRTKGLNTILTNSEQVIDTCLVPFVVLVDRTSLQNGIIHVTNKSTTLSEAVHITDLVNYICIRC